ncbi:MAG: type II secretion system F family protein [Methylococcaceae bacterium]|nr:type II secretion system F family protein [Methylococcaceae bacterium]
MKYQYQAINKDGGVVTGSIDVDNERAAARQLQRQGLVPVTLSAQTASKSAKQSPVKTKAKSGDVLLLMHQLTTLLKSGVSLDEAIASLAESLQQDFLRQELTDISTQLRRGVAFSKALAASKINLPPYMFHLATAGELTGSLAESLSDGVTQMEYEQRIASELRNALIYPSILIVSGISAVMIIFVVVVPKFTKLLSKAKGDIPFLAKAVLETGQFVNNNITIISALLASVVLMFMIGLSKPDIRQRFWDVLMTLPLLGTWLIESDIGRWSAMLSTLLSSKVELTRALDLAQQGVSGSRLRANFSQVTKAVKGGRSLADALQESGAITATGYGLIKVGERSGELPAMLKSLGTLYTDSGRERMKRFLALLEPIAILVIGAVIGVIMTGIILAITSVNDISV